MLALLKAAREERGMSQAWVGRRLGKPQSYVSKVERGERRIDPPELVDLAHLYGKSVQYFLQATYKRMRADLEREIAATGTEEP